MYLLEFAGVSRWTASPAQFEGARLFAQGLRDLSFLALAWTAPAKE